MADIMKLLMKVRGLEALKLAYMDSLKDWDLPMRLRQNSDSVTHLDLSGSKINPSQQDDFIRAVGGMKNIQSLKLIDVGLSNDQTVTFARALEGKSSLAELELPMPYNPSLGAELIGAVYQEIWSQARDLGGVGNLVGQLIISPIAVPVIFTSFTIYDAVGFFDDQGTLLSGLNKYGLAFRDTLCSLSKVANLQSLKLHISNLNENRAFLRKKFNELRTEIHKLGSTEIEFVK